MAGVDNHAAVAQTLEPGAQQWCGFHVGGEHPAGAADKGLDAQLMNPAAQRVGVEAAQQRRDLRCAFGVAREERRVRFGMGDVHAADPGQQELAPHRGHAVVQVDTHTGLAQHFGGHQAGGATADDDDVSGEGAEVWVMACAAVWRDKARILTAGIRVGAAAGCDLLILALRKQRSKDRSLRQLLQGDRR